MKLLSLKQTSCRGTDVVFRASGVNYAIATLLSSVGAGVAGYFVVYGHIGRVDLPRWIATAIGLSMLLFVWAFGGAWRAARHPTNWIVRLRGNEVLIKFRSFANWKMSEDDVQVIELHRDEIAYMRNSAEREITITGRPKYATRTQRRVDLEIGLKEKDTSALEKELAEERGRPGWGNKRMRTKVLDYPVQAENGVIRVAWSNHKARIRPGIKAALAHLGRIAKVEESEIRDGDYTTATLKKLDEQQQSKKLAELAQRDVMAATMTARDLYGCSLAEARKKVQELSGGTIEERG